MTNSRFRYTAGFAGRMWLAPLPLLSNHTNEVCYSAKAVIGNSRMQTPINGDSATGNESGDGREFSTSVHRPSRSYFGAKPAK
jgi:hypothetical protein